MKAAVMGAGSWGTTFAQVLCDAGTRTVLYSRRAELAKAVRELHENPDYLPGITLAPALDATCDPAVALAGADLVAFAVPAAVAARQPGRLGAAHPARARCWSA